MGQPGARVAADHAHQYGSPTEHVAPVHSGLAREVSDSGVKTFTMDPSSLTANSGTMPIWTGVTEAYQTETFSVPRTAPDIVPIFVLADYQYTGPGSLLHVACSNRTGRTRRTASLRAWPTSSRRK